MYRIGNATNSYNGSNNKEGTSSTGMNVRETQSAFSRESHEARPRKLHRIEFSQKTVKIDYDFNQSCDQLVPTLKNALVPYTGKKLDTSPSTTVSILNNSEAKRVDLLANIRVAIRFKNWGTAK